MTKKLFTGLACATAILATGYSQTVVSDDFSTYSNAALIGQNGWTILGTSVVNPLTVTGGTVGLAATGQDAYQAFSTAVNATIGDSLITTMSFTLTSVNATGDYFFHISNPSGSTSNFYQRIYAMSSGAGFVLGLAETSVGGATGATLAYGTTVLSLSALHTLQIRWDFNGGSGLDLFTVSVDGSSYLTKTWTATAAAPLALASLNIRQGSTGPLGSISDISITAVPEPHEYALAVAGLLAVVVVMRRRKAAQVF